MGQLSNSHITSYIQQLNLKNSSLQYFHSVHHRRLRRSLLLLGAIYFQAINKWWWVQTTFLVREVWYVLDLFELKKKRKLNNSDTGMKFIIVHTLCGHWKIRMTQWDLPVIVALPKHHKLSKTSLRLAAINIHDAKNSDLTSPVKCCYSPFLCQSQANFAIAVQLNLALRTPA